MDQPVDGTLYSGPEACRAASISYRQLDYWDRKGILRPSRRAQGQGSVRGYSFDEIVALAALGHLSGGVGGGSLPDGMLRGIEAGTEFVAVRCGGDEEITPFGDVQELVAMYEAGGVVTVLALGPLRERVRQVLAPHRDMVGIH